MGKYLIEAMRALVVKHKDRLCGTCRGHLMTILHCEETEARRLEQLKKAPVKVTREIPCGSSLLAPKFGTEEPKSFACPSLEDGVWIARLRARYGENAIFGRESIDRFMYELALASEPAEETETWLPEHLRRKAGNEKTVKPKEKTIMNKAKRSTHQNEKEADYDRLRRGQSTKPPPATNSADDKSRHGYPRPATTPRYGRR